MFDLKKLYGDVYKITLDESITASKKKRANRPWLQQIPCKYGHIYIAGRNLLGAHAAGRLVAGRLATLPGVTVRQRGDAEVNVVFPREVFPAVAALLQARKRRKVSPEQARAGAERLAAHRALIGQGGR
jgi:hypothetical protein